MKVNRMVYDAVRAALAMYSRENLGGIQIGTTGGWELLEEGPSTFGVNWGAHGTVSSKEAREYGRQIISAARIADELTEMELEVDWNDKSYEARLGEYSNIIRKVYDLLAAERFLDLKRYLREA